MHSTSSYGLTQPELKATASLRRRLTVGLPADTNNFDDCFPLTPEGAKSLIDRGYKVLVEAGAGRQIHYPDNAYLRQGVEIVTRQETLLADIVVSLSPLSGKDIKAMRRGTTLLTSLCAACHEKSSVDALLERGITAVALDLVEDNRGNRPFADILAEIDGRAAISAASSMLADSRHGKGILLGGVAGIVPCEVTVIGSSIAAIAAARSAIGLGATVRMFDDDAYSLRAALRDLGPQIIGSSLHEKVFHSALRSADVVINTVWDAGSPAVDAETVETMKRGVLTFDLSAKPVRRFPSMPKVRLKDYRNVPNESKTDNRRVCYTEARGTVPRTTAMALSNTLLTLFNDISLCNGATNAMKLTPGIRKGTLTFMGKATDPTLASVAQLPPTDINLFIF